MQDIHIWITYQVYDCKTIKLADKMTKEEGDKLCLDVMGHHHNRNVRLFYCETNSKDPKTCIQSFEKIQEDKEKAISTKKSTFII